MEMQQISADWHNPCRPCKTSPFFFFLFLKLTKFDSFNRFLVSHFRDAETFLDNSEDLPIAAMKSLLSVTILSYVTFAIATSLNGGSMTSRLKIIFSHCWMILCHQMLSFFSTLQGRCSWTAAFVKQHFKYRCLNPCSIPQHTFHSYL